MSRRARPVNGAGDRELVEMLGTDYRLWAKLPVTVTGLIALTKPFQANGSVAGGGKQQGGILAAVPRPVFPRGVCDGCGCSAFDACVVDEGMGPEGCHWIDETQRRCSACGPRRPTRARARRVP